MIRHLTRSVNGLVQNPGTERNTTGSVNVVAC